MRILFMGTPDFALAQLKSLWEHRLQNNWEIIGVLCQPDKPKGRSYTLTPPPVKVWAQEVGLAVFQPQTLKDESFSQTLQTLDPELIVVAAYGKLLPKSVLDYPKYGCINVHGSLLPAYRGAAPIQRAIIDGQSKTGITIMYMAEGLDTGDMLAKQEIDILPQDDFGSLYDKMEQTGAELLAVSVPKLIRGELIAQKQDDRLSNYAPKIEKSEAFLDFSDTAEHLHNKVRGLSPMPLACAFLTHNAKCRRVKISKTTVWNPSSTHGIPGTVLECNEKEGVITVACGEGILGITAVTPEGKGCMSAAEFCRGRQISVGDLLQKDPAQS